MAWLVVASRIIDWARPIGGEHWWLPPDQSQHVRQQLKSAHPELIEHWSDYEDATRHSLSYYVRHTIKAIKVPSEDPNRRYLGTRRGKDARVFVSVNDTKGNKYPLRHADSPYLEANGTGFEWGYGGHGPNALSYCILADALDGDLPLAEELNRLESGFFEKFVLVYPREESFRITRAKVVSWLKDIGKFELYEKRRRAVADGIAAHASVIAEKEDLLKTIRDTGGLRSQRFDVVPESFESALYVDLMRMLEVGGAALRCSHCHLPISDDHSGRANKQRARSRSGRPIYHLECSNESTRLRKKAYWERRAKSPQFREKERVRARAYRKM